VQHPDSGGFRVLGEEPIVKGARVDMVRLTVQGPDGSTFEREVVRHPGAVAVVPVTEAGEVLLVRQFRSPIARLLLEIPAGTRDVPGEAPEETALRELEEEVGVKANKLVELGRFWNTPGFCDEETILYLATELEEGRPHRGGVEEHYLSVEKIPIEQVEAVLASEGPVDLQTKAGIDLAKAYLAPTAEGNHAN
jgi:8-oxo-dGTP pyrophosphatase MutT (NUDIX family)